MNKNLISIIIPAYQPDEKLIGTINGLVESGFYDILVVDDGSRESCKDIFDKVEQMKECTLLRHEINKGKGAALKTAITYFNENRKDKEAVVTVDADGQHLVEDIEAVSKSVLDTKKVVFGVRNFSNPNVPLKSKLGNNITATVFRLFFGMKLSDTQTGLRAFPKEYLVDMAVVEGDRYEYETNVLLFMNRHQIPFEQVEITTVYIEENKSSHFRAVRDSLRIYALILKYLFSSAAAAVIDTVVFYILKKWAILAFIPIPLTYSATIGARIISSLVNYGINAKHVFKEDATKVTFVKYYMLAAVQLIISATLVFVVEHVLHITSPLLSTVAKAVIDTILFFFSFRIQHKWVFNNKSSVKGND